MTAPSEVGRLVSNVRNILCAPGSGVPLLITSVEYSSSDALVAALKDKLKVISDMAQEFEAGLLKRIRDQAML